MRRPMSAACCGRTPRSAIAWPIERGAPAISDRDATAATLAASAELFE